MPRGGPPALHLLNQRVRRFTPADGQRAGRHQFLDEIPRGPAILLIEGEAGIGKTTLWEFGVKDAVERGYKGLVTRGSEAETKLAYTALGDLLEPAGDAVLAELPDPQRKALLADTPLPAPHQRAVSLAALAAQRAFAEAGPTLLALDDLQWLDVPSARVMGFVVRRLRHERVGVLASIRPGERGGDPLGLRTALPQHPARRIPVGLNEYEKRGRYVVRDEILCYLAEAEARAGNWDVAAAHANEAYEIDVESGRLSGQGHMLFPVALVAALRGEVKAARPAAERGLSQCLSNGDLLDASCHRWVLGFLELSLSDPSAAMEHFEPAIEYLRALGAAEPGIIPCVPDAIEALVALGDLGYAEALLEEHELKARTQDRPWALATAARCRGLVAAAEGDLSEALRALDRALEHHENISQPFDLGRTILVAGEVNRRGKRKRAARLAFHRAQELFEEVGAPLWIGKAEAGLSPAGARAAEPRDLRGDPKPPAECDAKGHGDGNRGDRSDRGLPGDRDPTAAGSPGRLQHGRGVFTRHGRFASVMGVHSRRPA